MAPAGRTVRWEERADGGVREGGPNAERVRPLHAARCTLHTRASTVGGAPPQSPSDARRMRCGGGVRGQWPQLPSRTVSTLAVHVRVSRSVVP